MRKTTLSITLLALAAAAVVALRAPAVAPPDLDRALTAQQEQAARYPADPQVQNDLGNLLLLAGQTEAAEEAYRRALEVAPDMTPARYNLGLLLLQTERPKAALQELRRVVEAEPDNAWAHYQIGAIHDHQGAERKAVKHYGAAFRLDPQLGFPEVNPHVIQNEHVIQAMLLAYRGGPLAAQAPKSYTQPGRIVSLMLPPTDDAVAPAQATGVTPTGEGPAPEGMRPRPTYSSEGGEELPAAGAEAGGRVLREQDLERGGTVNQIVVPGSVPQTQPRGGTRTPVRTRTTPGSQGRDSGAQPQPGRERFVPGVPSTGRLEIELVPGEGDEVAFAG